MKNINPNQSFSENIQSIIRNNRQTYGENSIADSIIAKEKLQFIC